MGSERESLCALEPGKEETAFKIIGPFDIEACGPFLTCSHKVEKFDYSGGKETYIELFYCGINWYQVGFVAFLILLVFFYYKMKTSAASTMYSGISNTPV